MKKENENKNFNEDPLSRFMFGINERPKRMERTSEELDEVQEDKAFFEMNRNNQLDDWLFGKRETKPSETDKLDNSLLNNMNHIASNINLVELMDNIDTLVHSVKQIKPLFQKVSPFIDQFLKK